MLQHIVSSYFTKRNKRIEKIWNNSADIQNETLCQLLKKGNHTFYGKKHHFNKVKNYKSFKKFVPLTNYETISPYIQQAYKGNKDVLWPGKISWFAKSSGTSSGNSKIIPLTKQALYQTHYKGGRDLLARYQKSNPKSKLYLGKHLILGGANTINQFQADSYCGDLSSFIVDNFPFWVERKRTPKKEIALLDNWEEKIEKLAQATIHENVVIIAGVPSWTLLLLQHILEITGKSTIKEVWPNLELFMHGGINFQPYKKQFQQIIGKDINYYQSYNATEGYFGLQANNTDDDMLLMLDYGIFYEFIPVKIFKQFSTLNDKNINQYICAIDKVEKNIDYVLIITTNTGLWRYVIGDTVKFTSILPYKFIVSGRITQFINAFGEELIIENVEQAMAATCQQLNVEIIDYTAAPILLNNKQAGFHQYAIEFKKNPENIQEFATLLDYNICQLNSDYQAKRSHHQMLSCLQIVILTNNTFYNYLKKVNKLGGQHKTIRLSNDSTFITKILKETPLC